MLGVGLWALLPTIGLAQTPKNRAQEAASKTQFQKLLRQAVAEFELGNWVEARALFERAHELEPSARTLRAMGLCAFEEKSYVASIVYLTSALEDPRKPLDKEEQRKVSDVASRAREFIGRYALEITPSDASIKVDMALPVIVEGKILLDPGSHELTVSAPGYHEETRRLMVKPREERQMSIALSPLVAEEPKAAVSSVTAATQPERQDGPAQGKDPKFMRRKWAGLGVGSFGAASLVTGVVLGVLAKSTRDDSGCQDSLCPTKAAKRENDKALSLANASTVTLAVGAAAVATGAFLYFWPGRKKRQERPTAAQLHPVFGTGIAGAELRGAW